MTRKEHLQFCKICRNQKYDIQQGILCGLTNSPADFETSCNKFIEDSELKIQQELKPFEKEITFKIAGKGKRFANYLLDFIFIRILGFVFGFILGIILVFVWPESLADIEEGNLLLEIILGFIISMLYYTLFEAFTGRTIAKYITNTKVVLENGEKPDFRTILTRSLCRFIPFEPFSFLGSDNSGWHDNISGTFVVEN